MKIWKILIAFVLPYFILGCCDCVVPIFDTYSHCNLQVQNIDNAGAEPIVSSADTILKRAYGIRLEIERTQGFCKKPSSVFNSAYAFSCGCPDEFQYNANDSIVSFKIKTLNDFDATHKSGDTINDYFFVSERNDFKPFGEYVQKLGGTIGSDLDKPVSNLEFDIFLMTPPAISGTHSFEVEILFADNHTLTATTQNVFLK